MRHGENMLAAISCSKTTTNGCGQPRKRDNVLCFEAARLSVLNFFFYCLDVVLATIKKILTHPFPGTHLERCFPCSNKHRFQMLSLMGQWWRRTTSTKGEEGWSKLLCSVPEAKSPLRDPLKIGQNTCPKRDPVWVCQLFVNRVRSNLES